jgi:hypothetical protein
MKEWGLVEKFLEEFYTNLIGDTNWEHCWGQLSLSFSKVYMNLSSKGVSPHLKWEIRIQVFLALKFFCTGGS